MEEWLIVIGASAGALPVLQVLLEALPTNLNAAVLIVMHVAPDGPGLLPTLLQRVSALPVAHPVDGEQIRRGHVYVAPPDRHMVVDGDRVRLTRGPKENLCRPAVDPLFRSAAFAYGPRVIGVILSGRLDDGSAGLWTVKKRWGTVVVQDPDEATHPSMPRSALQYVAVDHRVIAAKIAPLLSKLTKQPVVSKATVPRSRELEIETRIAKEENALSLGLMELGPLTAYTCPECHGVLVQLKEGGVPRFRCHTGHAYSLNSLLSEVTTYVENSLWNAVRSIEEVQMLVQHVAKHMREQGDEPSAERFETKARETNERAELVRKALLMQDALSLDSTDDSSKH